MRLAQLNDTSFEQLKQYFDTVLIAVGSLQSHGPHMPFGSDSIVTEAIVRELDEQFSGRILTLPSIAFGHCFALRSYAGTIDIPDDVLRDYVYHTLRPIQQWGFKHIVLVNGNQENIPALKQAVELLVEDGMNVFLSNWWQDFREQINEIAAGSGHGGEDETSVLLAIQADLVDLSQIGKERKSIEAESDSLQIEDATDANGYSGATNASKEKGEKIFNLIKQRIACQITALWQ